MLTANTTFPDRISMLPNSLKTYNCSHIRVQCNDQAMDRGDSHTQKSSWALKVKFANVSAASRRPTKTVAITDRNKVLIRERVTNVHIMR